MGTAQDVGKHSFPSEGIAHDAPGGFVEFECFDATLVVAGRKQRLPCNAIDRVLGKARSPYHAQSSPGRSPEWMFQIVAKLADGQQFRRRARFVAPDMVNFHTAKYPDAAVLACPIVAQQAVKDSLRRFAGEQGVFPGANRQLVRSA